MPLKSFSQIKRTEVIGSYIYNFAKHSELKNCNNLKTYNIFLISEDAEIINEFKLNISNKRVHNKKINLSISSNDKVDLTDACLVFVSKDKTELFPKILGKTKNSKPLLVTYNYYDKRKIMLNLLENSDGKITFEYNKANIFEKDIKLSDEMLLYGGTEVDNIEFYLQSKKDLERSEKDLENIKREIIKINEDYKAIKQKAKLQEVQMIKEKEDLDFLRSKIDSFHKQVKYHKNDTEKQKLKLAEEKNKLLKLSDSLLVTKTLLEKQKKQLVEGYKNLYDLKDEVRKRNTEIKVQELSLGEQYGIIQKQKKINILFIVVIILGLILLVGLLIGFFYRKRKNNILRKQKNEITQKSLAIKDHLEKKKMINELLKDKNEELINIIEQLKNTQNQLIQAEKMASLGVLTAGIAHEINNPINFIYTGINSLQKDFLDVNTILEMVKELKPSDKDLSEKISKIQKIKEDNYFDEAVEAIPQTMSDIRIGAERTAEIIDGLRKFSRMDENKYVKSNIQELIQTALLMLKSKYKNKINIIRNFDKNLPQVYCNPGKITQVIMNIIINAIDAINENDGVDGKLEIRTEQKNDKIQLYIKDNGIGISEEVKSKMFDPFFTTKDVGKGTGLGLAISFGIIEEHKGKISMHSEVGEGTEFLIILPLKN